MGKKNKGNHWNDDDRSRKDRQVVVSKEELSEYIHACRPGVIVVIVALLLMLIAVLVWGFVGTLPVTETVNGLVIDASEYDQMRASGDRVLNDEQIDELTLETEPTEEETEETDEDDNQMVVICFVDASRFNREAVKKFRNDVVLKMPDQRTFKGRIEVRYMAPVSIDKAKKIFFGNEWVLKKCVPQDYNWLLFIRSDEDLSEYNFTLSEVTFVTEEVPPIRFLMK